MTIIKAGALDEHDDTFWDTDFDSDGNIDAEDDIIGDLLLFEYMQENEHSNYRPAGHQKASSETNSWIITIAVLAVLIIVMIVCSNSV